LKSYARNPKQVHQKLWEKLDFIRIGMRTLKPDVLHYTKDLAVSKVAAILKPLNIMDMTIAELGKALCSKLLD
uniref:Reverse transcriptase domain-containing protein n=1 Tax=Strongyloides papillosus TaxID=174720 RepID=A0A0N5C6Z1_STREA